MRHTPSLVSVSGGATGLGRGRVARVGVPLLGVALAAAGLVLAALLLPDPTQPVPDLRLAPPSGDALLGRDHLGRDVASRLVSGGFLTLGLAASATLLTAAVGVLVALWTGYARGRITAGALDMAVQTLLALPSLWLPLVVLAFFGRSLPVLLLALLLMSLPDYVWVLQRDVRSLAAQPFVEAAQGLGLGTARVLLRELLPHLRRPVLLLLLLNLRHTVLVLSTLSFLGLGPGVSTPTWGLMIAEGRQFFPNAWWVVAWPSAALVGVIVGAGLVARRLGSTPDPLVQPA